MTTAGNAQGSDTSSVVIRARDLTAPTGRYTDRPWRAHVGRTHVAIVQRWLRDDFTPTRAIRRVVRWGDGKTTTWRRGTTVEHVYRKRGIFHPRVIITDRAGNHHVLSLHRIVVRR